LSLRVKRLAKSLAVSVALAGGGASQERLARSMMRMARIEYAPAKSVVYPENAASAFCISIDFDATVPGRLEPNGTGTKKTVELAEKHSIPMTWAICGKTAEEDRPSYESIVDSSVRHEIGIHTYSHIDASKATADQLHDEVEKCIGVLGLKSRPKTFIYPWNRVAHFDTIKELGFTAYRDKKRVLGVPQTVHGLWNVAPVYYLDKNAIGATTLIKRIMDLSISSRSVFHLWFHPWSVVDPTPEKYAERVMDPILSYVDQKRKEGLMTAQTIGDLADWLSAHRQVVA
jgi:Polysaccharide deacetylase